MNLGAVVIFCVLGLTVLFSVLLFYIQVIVYKHKVIVKELTGDNKSLKLIFKARDYMDKDKIRWWKLLGEKDKEKKLMPIPPPENIDITKKGKKIAEAWRTEEGDYIFPPRMKGTIKEFPVEMLRAYPVEYNELPRGLRDEKIKEWKQKQLDNWAKENQVSMTYQPFKTSHRLILAHNIRKAEERGGQNWKQQLPLYIGLGMLLVLIAIVMIFANEFAQPFLDKEKIQQAQMEIQNRNLQLIQDIKLGVQRIEANQQNPSATPTPTAGPPN